MKPLQNTVVFNAIPPAAIKDNAAFSSYVIDTRGLNYVEWHVLLGSIDAAAAVFKVVESDTKTNDTTLGGTPADLHDATTKPGADDDNGVWIVGVDLAKLPTTKRYLQLQVTAGDGAAGTYLAASCVAQSDGQVSSNASDRGVNVAEYAS